TSGLLSGVEEMQGMAKRLSIIATVTTDDDQSTEMRTLGR
ncbi:hypothetical protein ZOSMA_11598G00010, partial [Zostera marina]